MACSEAKCSDHSETTPLFACYGPCGNLYHTKCVGATNAFIDKINSSAIGSWYCTNCRKFSLSNLATKISTLKVDILRISKVFDELSLNFSNVVSAVNKFSFPSTIVDNSTSTSDLGIPQSDLILESIVEENVAGAVPTTNSDTDSIINSKKSKKRGRDGASSSKNIGPAPKKSNIKSNRSKQTKDSFVPNLNQGENLLDLNNFDYLTDVPGTSPTPNPICNDPDSVLSGPIPLNPLSMITPNPLLSETIDPTPSNYFVPPRILEAVPKPKSIFISRLLPEISPEDILQHLVALKNIPNSSSVKCIKISKPNSFVSSFKITAPQALFDPICSSSWPPNTLVKEFSIPSRQKRVQNTTQINNSSKNLVGLPSTTKM